MKSLIVAPRTSLNIDDEMQRLVNTLHPTMILLGAQASLLRVLDVLAARQYDLVVFLSHGTMEGIQLADGMASATELSQVLRGAGVKCVFLNTCDSIGVAIRLHDEVRTAAIIATIGEVDNDIATLTGALFAQHLAAGASWREAYEMSKPGDNATYIYINDRMVGSDALTLLDEIRRSSEQLRDTINEQMFGLKARMDTIERRRQPAWERRLAWTIGFMLFAYVAYPLSYDDVRAYLDIGTRDALVLAAFVLALSGVLMMRAIEGE